MNNKADILASLRKIIANSSSEEFRQIKIELSRDVIKSVPEQGKTKRRNILL